MPEHRNLETNQFVADQYIVITKEQMQEIVDVAVKQVMVTDERLHLILTRLINIEQRLVLIAMRLEPMENADQAGTFCQPTQKDANPNA